MSTTTVTIDLVNEYAVNIGATYRVAFQLCNAPDLEDYTGYCQIRSTLASNVILEPEINILTKDTFELVIPFGAFTGSITPGNYLYDVLFAKVDDRFFPIAGKIQLIQRVTSIDP